jgi:hypothetical protein
MQTAAQPARQSKALVWTGRVLSALPALLMIASAAMKLAKLPAVVQGFARAGIPESLIVTIGILELACALIYLVPQTATLGAILVTGYLGGATFAQLRGGESVVLPVLCGVLIWAGLFLRDQRLRPLLPLRSSGA